MSAVTSLACLSSPRAAGLERVGACRKVSPDLHHALDVLQGSDLQNSLSAEQIERQCSISCALCRGLMRAIDSM